MNEQQIQRVEGDNCPNCDGKFVKNPRTGKIFCANKCWITGVPQAPQPPVENNSANAEQIKQENINKNVERKEDGIAWSNAKNNATLLVCHVNIFRMITEENQLKNKVVELAHWLYNEECPPFKG